MNKLLSSAVVSVFALFALNSCSSSESVSPVASGNKMSFIIDGTKLESTDLNLVNATSKSFVVGNFSNGYTLAITIPSNTGTFALGGLANENSLTYQKGTTGSYISLGTPGQLAISENSATKISGSFSGSMLSSGSATGYKTISAGVFTYLKK